MHANWLQTYLAIAVNNGVKLRQMRCSKKALEMGFEIRSDGCIAIHRLLAHQRFRGYTLEEIRTVVRDSDKQRWVAFFLAFGWVCVVVMYLCLLMGIVFPFALFAASRL